MIPSLFPERTDVLYLFRDEPAPKGTVITEDDTQSGEEKGKSLLCAGCGNVVTTRDQRMTVDSKHLHTFFNPAGLVYELGCFQKAAGCIPVGERSGEFAWFAGHLWRVGVCSNCLEHLGWLFESADSSFFGLIVSRLVESSDE